MLFHSTTMEEGLVSFETSDWPLHYFHFQFLHCLHPWFGQRVNLETVPAASQNSKKLDLRWPWMASSLMHFDPRVALGVNFHEAY